jgi:outer membrane protein
MKKILSVILGTLILFVILYAPSAFALGFGAQVKYWIPTFNGDLRVDGQGMTGTTLDMEDDLGIDKENFPVVEAFFGMGNHEFRFAYSQINLSGAKHINRPIIFDGNVYLPGAYVESDLNTNMFDLEYQYKFLNLENILAGFSLGLIGRIKYFDGNVEMRSSTPGSVNYSKENIQVPVPMIGLGLNIGILANILEARGKIVGMGYLDSYFYDGMAELSFTPVPFLNIHGGYRAMSIKIDDISDVYATMAFYGPYAGLTVSF